jgi:AcrR family transcriptional regulator
MGQRQELLVGAKACIAKKGYARTTARDIIAASGANLAAIGYHFGSKEALMNAAILESFDEWGSAVEGAAVLPAGGEPGDRFERFLDGLLSGSTERRSALVASVQAFGEAEFVPEVRQQLTETYDAGRRSIAAMLLDIAPTDVSDRDLSLGSLVLAIINGMVLQWLIEPESTPTAAEFAEAVRTLAGRRLPA